MAVTKYFIGGAPFFYPISFSHKKVYTTIYIQEALVNVLVKKKVITKKEIMDEIKKLNKIYEK